MPPKGKAKQPRAYLFWGPEERRKRAALALLLDELVPPEDRELDVQYLDAGGPGLTADTILHAARDRAMFSERRVVVVQNAGRLRGPRHQRTQEVLAKGLPLLPDYTTLILVAYAEETDTRRGRAPFGEELMAALKSAGVVKQFAPLKTQELVELAVQEAHSLGKDLKPATAAQLVNRIAADSSRMLQELAKLVAYVGERPSITPADIAELVPATPDESIFHLLRASMEGDRRQSLTLLRGLREGGTAVPQILAMLGRTLRQVAQAKFLQERGVRHETDAAALSPELSAVLPREGQLYQTAAVDWQRKSLWEQSRRISWPNLQRALDRLALADAGMKGSEYGVEDPDLAVELFVTSLCDSIR